MISAFLKDGHAGAIENAGHLAEAIKARRGETDVDHATALEIMGDVQALVGRHEDAASTFARVLELRRAGRPVLEQYFGIEKELPFEDPNRMVEYNAKQELRKVMSKLADACW